MSEPSLLHNGQSFIGQMGPWTQAAIGMMRDGKPGDFIKLMDMNAAVGRDCSTTGRGRQNVHSAICHVLNRYGLVWKWDRNLKGWFCLQSVQIVSEEHRSLRRATKAARTGLKKAAVVKLEELDQESLVQHQSNRAQLAMAELAGGAPFRRRLTEMDAMVRNGLNQPNADAVIKLMSRE